MSVDDRVLQTAANCLMMRRHPVLPTLPPQKLALRTSGVRLSTHSTVRRNSFSKFNV